MDQICSGLILVRTIFIAQIPTQIIWAQDSNNQMKNQRGNKKRITSDQKIQNRFIPLRERSEWNCLYPLVIKHHLIEYLQEWVKFPPSLQASANARKFMNTYKKVHTHQCAHMHFGLYSVIGKANFIAQR